MGVAVVETAQQSSFLVENDDDFEDAAVLDEGSRSLSASSGVELVQRSGTLTRRAKGARSLSMESSSPGGWVREEVSSSDTLALSTEKRTIGCCPLHGQPCTAPVLNVFC